MPNSVDLSEGELHALHNLARKHAGQSVPFINIADARSLTDAGLATRGREGWDITPAGLARVASAPPARET